MTGLWIALGMAAVCWALVRIAKMGIEYAEREAKREAAPGPDYSKGPGKCEAKKQKPKPPKVSRVVQKFQALESGRNAALASRDRSLRNGYPASSGTDQEMVDEYDRRIDAMIEEHPELEAIRT
jgi:hypothetical protein